MTQFRWLAQSSFDHLLPEKGSRKRSYRLRAGERQGSRSNNNRWRANAQARAHSQSSLSLLPPKKGAFCVSSLAVRGGFALTESANCGLPSIPSSRTPVAMHSLSFPTSVRRCCRLLVEPEVPNRCVPSPPSVFLGRRPDFVDTREWDGTALSSPALAKHPSTSCSTIRWLPHPAAGPSLRRMRRGPLVG